MGAILKKILHLNIRLKAAKRRCRFTPKKPVTKVACKEPKKHLTVVRATKWRHAVTCNGMRKNWAKWLKYMQEKRRRLHCQSANCNSLDTSCLKMTFRMLVHVSRRVRDARTVYSDHLMVCDKCGPIKLRFHRWVRRQRRRRLELHEQICRCEMKDVNCHASKVLKIKQIQQEIIRRRHVVMHLHNSCAMDPMSFI